MMSQIYRAQQKVQKLTQRHSQMRISRYLKRWMLTESQTKHRISQRRAKSLKKKRSPKNLKKKKSQRLQRKRRSALDGRRDLSFLRDLL